MTDFYNKVSDLQDITINIVQKEQDRLNNKRTGINDAYNSQQRTIALNQSYAMRMRAWSYLLAVIAVSIVISIILMFAKQIIPPTIIDILIIIVMSGGIIWAFLIYMDIQKRDENDYNLLSMKSTYLQDPTAIDSSNATISSSSNSGTSGNTVTSISSLLLGDGGTCMVKLVVPPIILMIRRKMYVSLRLYAITGKIYFIYFLLLQKINNRII
jgi:hypothetical protein